MENLDDSKKRTSLQELLNSDSKEFSGLEWENFQTDLEAEQELNHLQDQLEVIEANIKSLENFKKITSTQSALNLLVWTTTPWTLPVNVALGVGPEIEYSVFYLGQTQELVIVAEKKAIDTINLILNSEIINTKEIQSKLDSISNSSEYFELLEVNITKIASLLGTDLEGLIYKPPFQNHQSIPSYEEKANMYKVYTTQVVTDTDGTGILHIAPAYGVDDFDIKKAGDYQY
ncbi:MAG: class I tRNA ligase family protein [Thermales bacterium]|nr:class I tRNA ligase family protein [Thermales bacterium]